MGAGIDHHEQIRVIENLSRGNEVHRMLFEFLPAIPGSHSNTTLQFIRHRRRASRLLTGLVRLS
jgi:hypothetical protein